MPTGYTAKVVKGQSFEEFVMGCARAFGALISMRDDPMDAPIPAELPHSAYYLDMIERYTAKLLELRALSSEECEHRAKVEADYCRKQAIEGRERARQERAAFATMVEKVEAWTPPTPAHQELKTFMLSQLRVSMGTDMDEWWEQQIANVQSRSGEEWRLIEIAVTERALIRFQGYADEEAKKVASNTGWVKALRESLK
jgi:hypothetical protein